MVKKTDREGFKQFLDGLIKRYNVLAPVETKEGKKDRIKYSNIESCNQVVLDRQPDSSPREYLLPQNKKMGLEFTGEACYDKKQQTIIFGVRSCDIEAIKVLDDVYLDDYYIDEHYRRRRNNSIIIGYSCLEGHDSCFCTSLGINPVENRDVPLYVFQEGEEYWFRVNDSEYEYLVADLEEGDREELEKLTQNRGQYFTEREFQLDIPVPLPEETIFSALFWEDIAEKCLGCGICTYYCPTCYCFGFFWETGEDIEKWRYWDSCMFSLFTKHASNHNPRENKNKRYRQRVMHKFCYHPRNYGRLACVGCGRCIRDCPVNLDIREVVKKVEAYLKEEGRGQENE